MVLRLFRLKRAPKPEPPVVPAPIVHHAKSAKKSKPASKAKSKPTSKPKKAAKKAVKKPGKKR